MFSSKKVSLMKKSLILFSVFAVFAACDGGLGEKGRTLARIDGKSFTEKDLEIRLALLPEDQIEGILSSPDAKRQHFETILQERLFALAGEQSQIGNHDSLDRRLALVDQRVISQFYFTTYLNEYDAFTIKELQDYYRADSSKFTGDSGQVLPFSKVIGRVADSLLISHTDLDSFFQANRSDYMQKAYCQASIIQTATREGAETALSAIHNGMSFANAAIKYSTYPNNTSGGNIGRIEKGAGSFDIGSLQMVDSLFFDPNTGLKSGEISKIMPRGANFMLLRADTCVGDLAPTLASIKTQVARDYIQKYKTARGQSAATVLRAKYRVTLISPNKAPTEQDIQAYYDQNKDSYMSPETFELYDIETSKEEKVLERFKAVKDLNQFKALASEVSENHWTKSQDGYIGVVKRDFCLPYGIGMLPDLFPMLDSLTEGKVSQPLESPDTQKWHFFWLVKKAPPQAKPLERVRALVKSDMETNQIANIKPEDTLAVFGSGKVFRESDVIFLKEELPPQMRDRYTRESLLDFLITWQVVSDEAKSLGLTDDPRLISMRLQNSDGFWGQFYQTSVLPLSFEQDTTVLAKTFVEKKSLFTHDTAAQDWHPYAQDIAAYLTVTQQDMDVEYNTNPDRYRHDSTLSAQANESADQYDVFQNLKPIAYQRLSQKVLDKLKARFHVRIVDPSLNEPSLEPTSATLKKAQDLHYGRDLNHALELYGKLRDAFPNRASLQDSVDFSIAQIYIEQEKYDQALAEYRRISFLYPNSPNNYKAMFMVGFIYSEHLKKDSAAVQAFESMLAKYPKSDLSEDADWMIRNIRSGGKLMPKLDDTTSAPAAKSRKTSE